MSMDSMVRDLMTALQGKQAPEAYDTQATVTRVDGDTLWVHIPGGVDETPVKKTIGASPGDEIQIRVSGGRAWAVGNATAPPTDDTQANIATKMAEDTAKTVAQTVEDIQRAGASLTVMEDQILSVVTELDGKNATYSQGRTQETRRFRTKAGELFYTKAGEPLYALTLEPPTAGVNIDAERLTAGDLWYNTDENNAAYRWSGTAWEAVTDLRISEISQKLDSITLRVVGSDGTVSEIKLNDQGQINVLGALLAQTIMAENITATGTFTVNNGSYGLGVDGTALILGRLVPGTTDTYRTWIALDLDGSANINASSLDIGGDVAIEGSAEFRQGVVVQGNPIPQTDDSVTLGSSSRRWHNIYTHAINDLPPVLKQTKTVTGTTSTNGTVSLGLNSNTYGVLSVRRTDAAGIAMPYNTGTNLDSWYARITSATGAAVTSASVTLEVDYYEK